MGLLRVIKTNTNIRKIFGKRELIIIEKQLLGVKLTQSEKNRLSRDVRKKLAAIHTLNQFSEEFNVKHGGEVKKIVEEAITTIRTSAFRARIKKIILFGSSVDNSRTIHSDIDIAVFFSEITQAEAVRFRLDIMKKVDDRVDIQVYNVLPKNVREEIDTKGKVLPL